MSKRSLLCRSFVLLAGVMLSALLVSCGGGGSTNAPDPTPPPHLARQPSETM